LTLNLELKTVLLIGITLWAGAGLGAERCSQGSQKKGYWWGCEPVEQDDQALGPPPEEEVLLAMLPAQVEQLMHDYRENALLEATEEAVLWYYQLQDFARRRAVEFANLTEVVMLKNPDLNMQTQYPANPPGMAVRNKQRSTSIARRLAAERDRAALILLMRASCPYCEPQRAALRHFQARHGWEVIEIDLDQRPSAITRFGTDFTPTTVVIFRDSDLWMPVAVGVESVPRIEESVYRALRLILGETSPGQFTLHEYQAGTVLDPHRGHQGKRTWD